jgi:tetratricopeptide (TPR) repeat protein
MTYPTAQSGPSFDFRISEGATKLVLYFSGTAMSNGKFNYWKIGNAIPTHRLFINNGRNHWYQDGVPGLGESVDETVETIRLWAKKLGASEIYTVGQSMGAHGAILYGAKLGARVLAFNAETIIGLEASRSEKLMQDNPAIVYPDLRPVMEEATQPIYAFAGERDPIDLYCAGKAEGPRNYHPKTIIGIGHGMASFLHNRNRLVPLVTRLIENRPPPTIRAYGKGLERPGFAEAFYDQHRHMAARRFAKAAEAGRLAISLYGEADHSFYLAASALMAQGGFSEALPLIERALAIAPRNLDYRFLMARHLTKKGDKDRAVAMHRDIVAVRPDHAGAHYELAALLFSRRDFAASLEAARRAAELRPETAKFADLRDRAGAKVDALAARNAAVRAARKALRDLPRHVAARRFAEAAEAGRLATALHQKADQAFHLTAKALLALGEPAQALPFAERALAIAPDNTDYRFLTARCLARTGGEDRAVAMHRDIVAVRPDHAGAHYELAALLFSRRDFAASLEAARRAAELRPETAKFADLRDRAGAKVDALAARNAAVRAARKALRDLPRHVAARRFAEAAEAGRLATALHQKADQAFHLTAKALLALGEPAQALPFAERALAIAPDNTDYRFLTARCLARTGGEDRAVAMHRDIVAVRPDHAGAHYELAALLFSRRDFAASLEAARRAAELRPETAKFADLRDRAGAKVDALAARNAAVRAARKALRDLPRHVAARRFAEAAEAGRLATALHQKADQAFHLTAKALLALGEPAQALPFAERALAIAPDNTDYRFLTARCLARTGGEDRAVAMHRDIVAVRPDHAGAHYELAALLFSRRDFAASLEAARRAAELRPETAKFADLRDRAGAKVDALAARNAAVRAARKALRDLPRHVAARRFAEAAEAGRLATALHQKADQAFHLTAKALLALGEPAQALPFAERALAIAPDNTDYRFLTARCLARTGGEDRAVAMHRDIVAVRPDHAGAHYELAALLFSRRDFAAALEAARRAAELRPETAKFADLRDRAGAKVDALAARNAAVRAARKALRDLPRHVAARRFAEAAEAGRLATALHQKADQAFHLTAKALLALGEPAQALPFAERALAIAPDNTDYRFLTARCLARTGGEDRAVAMHRDIVAVRPDHAGAHYELAALLFSRRDFAASLEAARRAAELRPETAKFADLRDRAGAKVDALAARNAAVRAARKASKTGIARPTQRLTLRPSTNP